MTRNHTLLLVSGLEGYEEVGHYLISTEAGIEIKSIKVGLKHFADGV